MRLSTVSEHRYPLWPAIGGLYARSYNTQRAVTSTCARSIEVYKSTSLLIAPDSNPHKYTHALFLSCCKLASCLYFQADLLFCRFLFIIYSNLSNRVYF